MKYYKILLTTIIVALSISACNMVDWNDIVSLEVSPSLIKKTPKLYPGGNAECSTINIPGLAKTTGRNNYVPSTDGFEKGWPAGLLVKVENDKSVSFQIDGAIDLGDGKCYKVGAVIVKGGDGSNVYNYTDMGGATMDKGLVSPNNSSGGPAALSNLTFCFVECKEEPLLVAVKLFYWHFDGVYVTNYSWGASAGDYIFSNGLCRYTGVNYFPATKSFNLLKGETGETIGTATVEEVWPGGIHSLLVSIDLIDGLLIERSFAFAGTVSQLKSDVDIDGCPVYENWDWKNLIHSNTHTITIPYSEIK
jgi:hypothetical protein